MKSTNNLHNKLKTAFRVIASFERNKSIISFFLIFILLNMTIGCYYYKVTLSTQIKEYEKNTLQNNERYVVLHTNSQIWHLKGISIYGDSLTGEISNLKEYELYKAIKNPKSNRYKKPQQKDIVQVVNIFIDQSIKPDSPKIKIALSSIKKIEILDKDTDKTIASWVFGGIGLTILSAAIVFVIILLTKQSCPFIYIYDGEKFSFCGEIYSGAIHKPIERDDYLKLKNLKEDNGKYKIKITNEVHEIQNTNLAELFVIEHPANTDVNIDKYGNCFTLQNPQNPYSAYNLEGVDVLDNIKQEDTLQYVSNTNFKDSTLTDGIIATFNKPENCYSAKLTIRAKNTFWLDYVFGKFYELFGIAYNSWLKKQNHANAKELTDWGLAQNIPLSVYVEKDGKWIFKDYFNVIGPMAFKDDILKIDLKEISSGPFKVKLESGYNFWEIDKMAIDFGDNIELKKHTLPIAKATNNKGSDVSGLLVKSDSLYYTQPDVGDEAVIEFNAPKTDTAMRTVFLHSRGYYQILKKPDGIPDKAYLETFKTPGQFNKYANTLLKAYINK